MPEDPIFRQFVERLDSLIVVGVGLGQIRVERPGPTRANMSGRVASLGGSTQPFPVDQFVEWRTKALHLLASFLGRTDGHFTEYERETSSGTGYSYDLLAQRGTGILRATKSDVAWDGFAGVRSLVAAELFSDLLEAASFQLSAGYKDPAAVMAGAVLEQHLRRLVIKNGIEPNIERNERIVPMAGEALNQALGRAAVYSKLNQKRVTAILDIRNNAAHGNITEYSVDDVSVMLNDIRRLITDHPA